MKEIVRALKRAQVDSKMDSLDGEFDVPVTALPRHTLNIISYIIIDISTTHNDGFTVFLLLHCSACIELLFVSLRPCSDITENVLQLSDVLINAEHPKCVWILFHRLRNTCARNYAGSAKIDVYGPGHFT